MAKVKTIYPLKGVFSTFLDDASSTNFLIPTYQRGYKWASGDGKGQVDKLLKDLLDAYKSDRPRYYLQFITIKENGGSLEVIDGQQRLTTITIIFCVLSYLTGRVQEKNFVFGKLIYEVRKNFIQQFIYQQIDQLLLSESWNAFIDNKPEHDNQDIYFIYNAARAIEKFFKENVSANYDRFYNYIEDNVYLIINLLDSDLNSEKIFVNVNKGVKLNDEDLVKGLLITKIPIDIKDTKYRITDIEINELRSNLGRQWDEISMWASKTAVRDFFKVTESENRLEWLIRLSYPMFRSDESANPLFNYFDEAYRNNALTARDIFAQIRRTKLILNDWHCEPEIANLLGYAIHSEGTQNLELIYKELHKFQTKAEILAALKKLVLQRLPVDQQTGDLQEVNYEDHRPRIYNLFLLIDLSKFLPINGRKALPYNYSNIVNENWSIEHIFPQNAKDFKKVTVLAKADLDVLRELLPKKLEEITSDQNENLKSAKRIYIKITKAKDKLTIKEEEKGYLALLLKDNAKQLHTIGNLALLQRNINSSLSNHFFEAKRKIIVEKISEGKFVPFHTYDVFSKLIISERTGLQVWSANDIILHESYIKSQLSSLFNYLKPSQIAI